jgi:molybdopterin biosynthesis enzyme
VFCPEAKTFPADCRARFGAAIQGTVMARIVATSIVSRMAFGVFRRSHAAARYAVRWADKFRSKLRQAAKKTWEHVRDIGWTSQ